MQKGMRATVSDLWSNTDLDDIHSVDPIHNETLIRANNWQNEDGEVIPAILKYTASVFILSACAITLPLVAGVFTPTMAIGAGVGRTIGEVVQMQHPELVVSKGGYALAGAASVSAGVTHTISTAVVVVETSGQAEFMIPILIAVVISVLVS